MISFTTQLHSLEEYARGEVTDDSSIILKTGSNKSFGRIRRIFRVNDAKPIFYVDVISEMADVECATPADVYSCPTIQTGVSEKGQSRVFVEIVALSKSVFFINATTTRALSIDFLTYENVREEMRKYFSDIS